MSRDFEIQDIDLAEVEREARRLRAQALATGMRSVRDWTMSAFQRRSTSRAV